MSVCDTNQDAGSASRLGVRHDLASVGTQYPDTAGLGRVPVVILDGKESPVRPSTPFLDVALAHRKVLHPKATLE